MRKHYTAEQKYQIVKSVFKKEKTVSDVTKECGITTSMFYNWQDKFLAGALQAFESSINNKATTAEVKQINELTAETKKLKDVIAEISSENINLKKKHSI